MFARLGKVFGRLGAPPKAGEGAEPPEPGAAGSPIGLLLVLTYA